MCDTLQRTWIAIGYVSHTHCTVCNSQHHVCVMSYISCVTCRVVCAISPPAPMNHLKIFKGWPPRDAPSTLVQLWYKSFRPDQRGLRVWSKWQTQPDWVVNPVPHYLVRRIRFWRIENSRTWF